MSNLLEKAPQRSEFKTLPLNIRCGHRIIFKPMGFTSEGLSLPRIAIVNSRSKRSPRLSPLRSLPRGVKAGIRMAGACLSRLMSFGRCSVLNAGPANMLLESTGPIQDHGHPFHVCDNRPSARRGRRMAGTVE
jgi:dihydroxyacid dehydratase/phosphogluconate dehydratase